MNNKTLILTIFVIILVAVAGGYFALGRKTQSETPARQNQNVPTNPPGVLNPDVQSSNYKLYSKDTYEQALKDKKVVMLFFTANWCPICREQEPVNMQVLESLKSDSQIIAFRVHILDNETTKETEELAKKYDVPYQHDFVIIGPSGKVVTTYIGPLSFGDLKAKLLDAKKS